MTELIDRIGAALVGLKMPRALEALGSALRRLEQGETAAVEAILSEDCALRETRRIDIASRTAKLLPVKTVESFGFAFQPSLDRERIAALAQLDFIRRRETVHFLGPPGTGKSRLDRHGHGASVPELCGQASGFRLEFPPPFAYHPIMANTSTSSMDQLVASGVDPKAAEAIIKLVETAVRSSGVADQSRQREAARLPASKEGIGWTGIGVLVAAVGVLIAVIGLLMGFIFWQNNITRSDVRAEFGSVRAEFGAEIGSVRAEIGSVREEFNAGIAGLREEFNAGIAGLRAEFGAEIGSVRAEISDLRIEVGADVEGLRDEVGMLRSEIGELSEQMIRQNMLIQDWMSSVTAELAE